MFCSMYKNAEQLALFDFGSRWKEEFFFGRWRHIDCSTGCVSIKTLAGVTSGKPQESFNAPWCRFYKSGAPS